MKRLWLTSIPDDYHSNKDILLGPWCILGKEDKYPNLESLSFEPDAFSSKKEIINVSKLTSDIAELYLNKIYHQLNAKLHVSYSYNFWKVLLIPWLITLIQTTWEKGILIHRIVQKYYNENIEVELLNDIEWNFKDTKDFLINGVQNINYTHWLFSRLLENQIPPKWKIEYRTINQDRNRSNEEAQNFRSKVYNYLKELFPSISVYGISIPDALILEILMKFKSSTSTKFKKIDLQVNEVQENYCNSKINFDLLIWKTIPRDIINIVKNINKFSQWKGKKNLILGGQSLYFNDRWKAKVAVAIENGARVITTQHGGFYGTAAVHSMPTAIEYTHFAFISWGWRQTNYTNDNIIPLPSPLTTKYLYKKNNNKIIFVNTSMHSLILRINSSPQPNQWLFERNNILEFINNLDNSVCKNFWYRPFFRSPGCLSDKEFIKKHFSSVNFLEGNLHLESMKCKLLVLNHPDTTLNIALAANVPSICFWNSGSWGFDAYADKYFNELKRVGIIFHKPLKAAKQINEIWKDVEGWWKQPEVQKARAEWVWQYARTNKRWRWKWAKVLWKI